MSGQSRFRGAGMQWKTPWRGRVPFTEMCCIEGFRAPGEGGFGGQSYQDLGGALDLDIATGSWLTFVVGLGEVPAVGTSQLIAKNGTVANEGWDLRVTGLIDDGVQFEFRILPDGGGETLVTVSGPTPIFDPGMGVTEIFYRIVLGTIPPNGFPNGQAFMFVEGVAGDPGTPIVSPYVNTTPALFVGLDPLDAVPNLAAPNCINGLAGGTGDITGTSVVALWAEQVLEQYQLVALPSVDAFGNAVTGYGALNGWRANYPELPIGNAPDPWLPFIGSTNLVYTYSGIGAGLLTVMCGPGLFAYPQSQSF